MRLPWAWHGLKQIRSSARPLAIAILLAAQAAFLALAQKGAVAGRLADLQFKPVDGAVLTLVNVSTGDRAKAVAGKDGAFRFSGLAPGEYALEVASPQQSPRTVRGIVVAAGYEAQVYAASAYADAPVKLVLRVLRNTAMPWKLSGPASTSVSPHPLPEAQEAAVHSPKLNLTESAGPEIAAFTAHLSEQLSPEPLIALPLIDIPFGEQYHPVTSPRITRGGVSAADAREASIDALANIFLASAISRVSHPEVQPKAPPIGNRALETEALSEAVLPARELPATAIVAAGAGSESLLMNTLRMSGRGSVVAIAASIAAQAALHAKLPGPDSAAGTEIGASPETSSTVITGEQLQALPLSGGQWNTIVTDPPAPGDETHGDARQVIAQTVDGASTRLAFTGWSSGRRAGQRLIGPGNSETGIQEVRISDREIAELNRAGGERAGIRTQSGGEALHGRAFLFERQKRWSAQNPFAQWIKETAPAAANGTPTFTAFPYTPADRQARWGVSLGGPAMHKRVFWFAAVDGDRRDHPAVSTVKHPDLFFAQPSNDEMQVLSARLALGSANPAAEGLAAYSAVLEPLAGLLGPAPRTSALWTGFGRLDWSLAERHRFTLEGTGTAWNSPGGGLLRVAESYGNRSFGERRGSEEWLLGRWETSLTPNLQNVAQASIGRHILEQQPEAPSAFEQSLDASAWGQLPQMVVDSRYGFTIGSPSRFGRGSYPDERLYEATETLHWTHRSLQMNAGVDLRHNSDATGMVSNHAGAYHYTHLENFISDALVFMKYGLTDALNPMQQHNCDQRGKAWRDANGQLHGLGYLPCYSYYSQTIGPTGWHVSTADWMSFAAAQWRPARQFTLSASLRWERQLMPPPMMLVNNPELPLTQKAPGPGNEWGPRVSLAWGAGESRWPVLRVGYGMYFGRTDNSMLETALTQTGSLKGDLKFLMQPTDNLLGEPAGAPPFPYVLIGMPGTAEKTSAVEFAPNFRNPEIHQAVVAVEKTLPGAVHMSVSALASLGRRLPITMDTNFDPAVNPKVITYSVIDGSGKGPIKAAQIKVPLFASWPTAAGTSGRLNPDYQQIIEVMSRANSTYEAVMLRISRSARRALSLQAHYTYAHTMDWNPNESNSLSRSSVLDPTGFSQEYGTSDLDIRHSASIAAIWQAPWKLNGTRALLANGWMLAGVGNFHSGAPYTMRTEGSIPRLFNSDGAVIVGLAPGINGYGGDDRIYSIGRNTYRYPPTWKADVRLGRRFKLSREREVQLMAETFNLFNHQNVTELETVGYYVEPGSISGAFPSLNFLTGLKPGQTAFGQPLSVNGTDFYRERQVQFGMRLRF